MLSCRRLGAALRRVFTIAFWLNLGLTTKMTLMVVVGLTALVVFFGWLGVSATQQTTARALQERIILARLIAAHMDYALGNVETLLQAAARHPHLRDWSEETTSVLRNTRLQSGTMFRQMMLLDDTHRVLAADPPVVSSDVLIAGLERRYETFTVEGVLWNASPVIVAIMPVRDESRQANLLLLAMLDLLALEIGVPHAVALGETAYLEIVDAQGRIVLSTRPTQVLTLADHGESLAAMIREGKSLVANCQSCHATTWGVERATEVLAFAPMRRVSWGVVIRQTEAEAFAPSRQLQGQIMLVGILSVVGAVVLVWLTTRSVIAPVQNLTRAAQRIARGDLETPVQIARGDEIGLLARAFDEMRARLQASIAEIQALNRDLDRRVQERTRELDALNAVAVAVAQPLHLPELLQQALAQVLRVTQAQAGAIFLLDEQTRALVLAAQCGTSEQAAYAMRELHLDDSACGGVIEKGHPVVAPDLGYYRSAAGRVLGQAGLRGLVHVPLISRDVALGTMCVATVQPREYEPDELDLLMAIGSQIAVGIENARLYDELARREQLRGELLEKVITAQEDERKRIARDLHDDTSQSLSALIYSLEALEARCADATVRGALATMRQRVAQILDGIHKLIFDLRPSMLDHLGLCVALRWYAETHLQPLGMRVHLEEHGTNRRLPPQMETALFRVVQEAINNIAKHSGARNVRLNFDCSNGALRIEVEDDGIGFDVNEIAPATDLRRGLGLVGMQERVGLLGGKITVHSYPGQGTHVAIYVPLEE